MKTIISLTLCIAFSFSAIAFAVDNPIHGEKEVSVLETRTSLKVQDPVPTPAVDQPVLDPAVQAPPIPEPAVVQRPEMVVPQSPSVMINEPQYFAPAPVAAPCCNSCCATPCCCPTPTTFCLVDPCGCSHEACVEVPACCAGQEPTVSWRGGLFGRQIATLCWACCGHEVKVIVTRRGKVRVRG